MIPSLTSEKAKTASLVRERDVRRRDDARSAADRVALDDGDHGRRAGVDRRRAGAGGRPPRRRSARARGRPSVRIHSMSAPAQKLGPSPASTTARAVPTSTNASASAEIMSPSNAFRVSGPGERDAEHVAVTLDPSGHPFDPRSQHGAGQSRVASWSPTRDATGAARHAGRERDAAAGRGCASSTPTRSARCSTTTSTRGLEGILAFGTTGEGILFSVDERRRGPAALPRGRGRAGSTSPPTAARRRPPTRSRSPPTRPRRGPTPSR